VNPSHLDRSSLPFLATVPWCVAMSVKAPE
jgi:hypothetical protein